MYKLNVAGEVLLESTGLAVPVSGGDPAWQAYRAWVDAGNTPAPYAPPAEDVAAMQAEQSRKDDAAALKADAKFQDLISKTPAQARNWVDKNFPTLTEPERKDLATIVIAIGVLGRRL